MRSLGIILMKVKPIFPDRGQPGFFKDIVQRWDAFDLVQIFHRYGLKPTFNESLCEWSKDLYSLVVVLGKNKPTTEDKDRAEKCLSTLFDVAITSTGHLFHGLNLAQNKTSKKFRTLQYRLLF